MKALRYFFCVVFPPLAVLLTGRIASFFLSVILTLPGWIPGVIHACLVVNDYHAEQRAAGGEIAHALRRQIGVSALGQPEEKKIAGHKRQHISEPIPSRSDVVVDPENDRIEVMEIVREHLRRDCH